MIKKTLTVISMFLLTTMLMWAVWEGNAAAGSNDEFPAGLFAYTTLLPKHTLIEVLNLENSRSSRAVVIGNTETDGLIIKMSPDLAAALAVRMGNTVRIRLSVPAHVAETGADPVLIAKNTDTPSSESAPPAPAEEPAVSEEPALLPDEPLPPVENPKEPVAEKPAAPKEVAPVAERKPASEMPPAPPEEVEPPVRPLDANAPESPHPVAEVEEPLQTETAASDSDASAVAAVQPVQQPPVEPETEPVPVAEAAVPAAAEPVLAEEVRPAEVGEPAAAPRAQDSGTEAVAPVAEVEEPRAPSAAVIPEALPDEVKPVTEPAPDEPELYEAYNEIPEYLAVEDEMPAEPVSDIPAAAEPADTVGDKAADEPLAETLPVEEVPPLVEHTVPEEEALAAVPPALAEQMVMLIPVPPKQPEGEVPAKAVPPQKAVPPPAPAPSSKPEKPAAEAAGESSAADTLKPGAFYVQIGNFTDSFNVQSFIRRYGKQYPVVVEKSESGRTAFYRVYIGPLKKDERGAALETFQKIGFKDAFLKKIP